MFPAWLLQRGQGLHNALMDSPLVMASLPYALGVVLAAIEDALRLDDLKRQHLRALVGSHAQRIVPKPAERLVACSGLPDLVAALVPIPAMVQYRRMDVLAINRAGRTLLADFDTMPRKDRNIVRWLFLDPTTRVRYPEWEKVVGMTVASSRAARDPQRPDAALEQLVGELSVASTQFST